MIVAMPTQIDQYGMLFCDSQQTGKVKMNRILSKTDEIKTVSRGALNT